MSERYHQAVLTQYEVGDRVSMVVRRDFIEVWADRMRSRRWNVEKTKRVWFVCTDRSPGAIWPEVK